MIERFRQLAPREQIVLGVGAALAFLIIGWSFVWTPLARAVDTLRETVAERSGLMIDLKRAATLPSTAAPIAVGSQDWYALVDATARPLGLAPAFTNSRGDANDTFRIVIQNAPFAQFVEWLITLDRDHGVRAGSVNLQPAARGTGMVSGQIVLSRS